MENLYAGIDEVGVSSIAGPLVAATVILPKNHNIIGLKDSKKISESQIKKISEQIKQKALFYFIKEIDNNIVDEIGVDRSIKRVWNKCAKETLKYIKTNNLKNIEIIVDGKYKIPILKENKLHKAIIKADESYDNVSAASIIAKDYCDEKMREIHKIYPQYNFKQHKGYATEGHMHFIEKYGLCKFHRKKMSEKATIKGVYFYNKKFIKQINNMDTSFKQFKQLIWKLFSIYKKNPKLFNYFQSDFTISNYYKYIIKQLNKEPSKKIIFNTNKIYLEVINKYKCNYTI